MEFSTLKREVLNLPITLRAQLSNELIAVIGERVKQNEQVSVAQAWEIEIERRTKQLESGTVKLIPARQVFSELRLKLQ
jgi:PIN domain nuclease of toxin-antitoxin system